MGGGKGKGPIVSGSCGHLSGQAENGESPCSADWPHIPPAQTGWPYSLRQRWGGGGGGGRG